MITKTFLFNPITNHNRLEVSPKAHVQLFFIALRMNATIVIMIASNSNAVIRILNN